MSRDPRITPEPGDVVVHRLGVGVRRVESVSACPPDARHEHGIHRAVVERWLAEHRWSRIGTGEFESLWWSRAGFKRWLCLSPARSGWLSGSALALNVEPMAASEGRTTSEIFRELGVVGCWVHSMRITQAPAVTKSSVCEIEAWRDWARGGAVVVDPSAEREPP